MIPGLKKRSFNLHDLMMYVALIRKHLRLTTLLLCLCMMGGLVYYLYARPVYYSRSLVHVDALALPLDEERMFHDSALRSIIMQMEAPHIVERTARRLGINADYKEILKTHVKKVDVKVNAEHNFEIEVWPYSYSLAARWPEVMVDEFLKFREEKRIKERERIVKGYKEEMSQLGERMDADTDSKFSFRDEKDITKAEIELERLKGIPAELVAVKKRISNLDDIREKLEDPGRDAVDKLSLIASVDKAVRVNVGQMVGETKVGSAGEGETNTDNADPASKTDTDKSGSAVGVVVIPSMLGNTGSAWQDLEKDRIRLASEIAEASNKFLPGHHKMVALRKELDDVEQKLDSEYESAKTRFDLEYQHLVDKQHELEAKLPEYQEINKKFAKLRQASRMHSSGQLAWDTMYGTMAKHITALDYTTDKERVNLEYLGLMELKDRPVSPRRGKLFVISIAMGLALGLGIPFLIEFLDHTISSFEQVEATFQLRGLGIIPQITGGETERPALLDLEGADERNLVENFRVIRTNLLSMGGLTKPPHVTMVTSSMPKEGKTVISSNLAISFAHTGARTLVIDTDLRRGRLHRVFGLRKSPGLSNVLLEKLSLDEAIRPTGKENLSVLTAGQHMESGTELLGSAKFGEVMQELRSRFDRIVVDTPPVLGLSETSILQNHVDGVLFVIWSGHTPIRNMKTSLEILQANGANFYGFILNRLDLSTTTNYYQYYYYSNDYYHNYHALENA